MARQTDKEADKQTVVEQRPHGHSTAPVTRGWWIGLGAAAIVIILACFALAAAVAYHANRAERFEGGIVRHGYMAPRMMGGYGGNYSYNGSGQSRETGVVTSVNGSSFTLAGNGATTKVTTSSSTQYQGGNQVKTNDTVIVWGILSNGTLSASQININP